MTIRRIIVAVAVVALATLAALAINASRGTGTVTAAPSPSPSISLTPSPSISATASHSASPVASPSQSSSVRPDAQHGLIVATGGLRTEDSERSLQNPSLFATAAATAYAVSPDGKRIALIKGPQLAGQQQIVWFTTARPNDVTTLVDLTGSAEVAVHVVWAGDGSQSVLVEIEKQSRGSGGGDNLIVEYAALRSVDVTSHAVVEIARISGQNNNLWPLSWLPARQLAAALEVRPLGPVGSFVLVRGGAIERTPMNPSPSVASFNASRDGGRVLMFTSGFVRWWAIDQPQVAQDLMAQSGETLRRAEFRPGTDEIGVDRVGPSGQFEVWSTAGQRRVVATRVTGFTHWRVDGTAAIAAPDPSTVLLIDPNTGATTPLPGGGFPVADVVLF